MSRFARTDFARVPALKPSSTTASGFLKTEGRIARTGVQVYTDAAGNVRRELRLPEEVAASVPQFAGVPLTNNHPDKFVDASNAKEHVVGVVESAQLDDAWVTAAITVYDGKAIAAARKGRSQLSVGYTVEVVEVEPDPALVSKFGPYTHLQKKIAVNHVALVDVARAGPDARMRVDSDELTQRLDDDDQPHTQEQTTMATEPNETHDAPRTDSERRLDEARRRVVDAEARADAVERDRDELPAAVATALSIGISETILRGRGADDVRRTVLRQLQPEHADRFKTASPDAVRLAFDSLTSAARNARELMRRDEVRPHDLARAGLAADMRSRGPGDPWPAAYRRAGLLRGEAFHDDVDPEDAREEMIKRHHEEYEAHRAGATSAPLSARNDPKLETRDDGSAEAARLRMIERYRRQEADRKAAKQSADEEARRGAGKGRK